MIEQWHKSTYSASGPDCVEVCEQEDGARIRDTKHRELGHLEFGSDQWVGLLATLTQ